MTKTILGFLATGVIAALLLMVGSLSGAVFGAAGGLVVGWWFGDTILNLLQQLGLHITSMWALGMTLGFIGGFFKSTLTTNKAAE